ncbi:MAG: coenzyme F420-0:L-glutamate ligase [Candidatus Peribacteraceae bacterium]
MLCLPIPTPRLRADDDLAVILAANGHLKDGDILLVSSKVIATVEGRMMALKSVHPGKRALTLALTCGQDPAFTELVLRETKRMNGVIAGTCPFALLTSLKPEGMRRGRILCPNAGLDQSNVQRGFAIGWPDDPVKSAHALRAKLLMSLEKNKRTKRKKKIAVIVTDSCCRPGRTGVTAFALVCDGVNPFQSEVGNADLFGKPLRFTHEAVADQLATAANFVMGNAGQSIPAAIVRDHGLPLTEFSGWVDGIDPEEDLFREAFKRKN